MAACRLLSDTIIAQNEKKGKRKSARRQRRTRGPVGEKAASGGKTSLASSRPPSIRTPGYPRTGAASLFPGAAK
ncbi:MAG TPA: hypothetical protein H9795_10720, partial [Candidatus Fournierella merdigallinarum]|nr:hypothetical protein [Candidatus Fournierella merdigallinarum]